MSAMWPRRISVRLIWTFQDFGRIQECVRVRCSNPKGVALGGRRGVALVYSVLSAFVLFGMVGLAIDGAAAYLLKLKLSQAVDAAVLAGARSLSRGADVNSQREFAMFFVYLTVIGSR
jgi:Flp pilus assembly protein TadG